MKKIIGILLITMLLVACKPDNHDGTYVVYTKNEYTLLNDTIIIKDKVIIKRAGYRKIRNRKVLPKAWSVQSWYVNGLDAPVIQFGKGEITIGQLTYKKIR
jgi:hypothetical protein